MKYKVMELKINLSPSDDHYFQPTTILAICKTQEGFPIYHKITSHKVKAFSMGDGSIWSAKV